MFESWERIRECGSSRVLKVKLIGEPLMVHSGTELLHRRQVEFGDSQNDTQHCIDDGSTTGTSRDQNHFLGEHGGVES